MGGVVEKRLRTTGQKVMAGQGPNHKSGFAESNKLGDVIIPPDLCQPLGRFPVSVASLPRLILMWHFGDVAEPPLLGSL